MRAEAAIAQARAAETCRASAGAGGRAALARIETEARTLAKILQSGGGGLFPAVLERIAVDRGYETALGAALGDDLEAPIDTPARRRIGAKASWRRRSGAARGRAEPGQRSCARRRSSPAGWRRSASLRTRTARGCSSC